MTVSPSDNLVNGCVYCKCVYQDWQNPTAMVAVPWSNMQIVFYSLTCMPHPHIFSYSRGEKSLSFLFQKTMHLLSFYFYFVKNAYLCFISSFSPLHSKFLLIGKTNFKQLSAAWQTVSNNHVFFAFSICPKRAGVSYWALTTHPTRELSGLMTEFQGQVCLTREVRSNEKER